MSVSALASSVSAMPPAERLAFVRGLSKIEALDLLYTWRIWARPEQVAPEGDWDHWLILAGRGFGKTRSGAEWVHEQIANGARRVALVARTAADIRDVMVEGESGILNTAHPGRRPKWNPSNRRLTWPNGAIATTFSAQEPNSLRGPQYEKAWCDELAAWSYAQETWDQLQMVLRLGQHPQACITTTPRPTPLVRSLIADAWSPGRVGGTVVSKGSTFDNAANLAASFSAKLFRKYDGTRLGRQELYAEVLDDNPGAMWKREQIEKLRVREAPDMKRIIIAVDPAATADAQSCECGIIVAGVGIDGHGYILADLSEVNSPGEWAKTVVKAYRAWKADRIIAEVNLGGALVEMLLRTVDRNIPYKGVRAAKGKAIRAEPVAALYEQGRVHHVGEWPELEDQLVCWDPGNLPTGGAHSGAGGAMQGATGDARTSSDRLDALVWALTELMVEGIPDASTGLPRAFPTKFNTQGGAMGGKFQW